MNVLVRNASLKDVSNIAQIHVDAWIQTYEGLIPEDYIKAQTFEKREALWRKIISKNLAHVLVAEQNQNLVGFASFGQDVHSPEQNSYELTSIYLLPKATGRGVGKALYSKCEEKLQHLQATSVSLWVLDTNHRAISFYNTLGFGPTGKSNKERSGNITLNDLEMIKRISIS
ncbi:GNAT family N-acetyltransferase [Grimontia kaedaensis]|uniref:GNAT family N-acetyltransferase n=1 Tax=Grimontia kaedaensis TaxID=2872157 RepID=A0ABY4WZG7_9GAMM|nr:GNAT family N-acetyltransferase [Grimontia kaedaensis]USH04348.1 GNAT family N-acetyltransferase [Grimontia kaedaensis]